mgnify:CR=1
LVHHGQELINLTYSAQQLSLNSCLLLIILLGKTGANAR